MFFKKWIEGFKQTKEQLKLTNHYKKQGFDEDEALKLAEEEFENLPYDQKSL